MSSIKETGPGRAPFAEYDAEARELIRGAYDLHVHGAPDISPRKHSDLILARQFRDAGMAGYVSKNHQCGTADRAALLSEAVPEIRVFGGIVLNHGVGGLNPYAVSSSGRMGGQFVWFPTADAANDAEVKRRSAGNPHLGKSNELDGKKPKIRILDDEKKLIPEVYDVLEEIRSQDFILSSGHISPEETLALLRAGKEMGIRRMIAQHVSISITKADLSLQKEYLKCGAMIEHCYYTPHYGLCSMTEITDSIRAAGPGRILLTTDFGQPGSPDPADGMRMFVSQLRTAGVSAADIRQMIVANPEALLLS